MTRYHLERARGACRLCGVTGAQRPVGHERVLGLGQWLIRCGTCGGAYLDPDMTPRDEARFYARDYRRLFTFEAAHAYDDAFVDSTCQRDVAKRRLARLPDPPANGRVLEIGSGYGAFLGQLHQARPDLSLYAIEPDRAHCRVALDGAPVHFAAAVEDLTGSFDLILLFHSLEHLREPGALLFEMRALLNPGGRIIIEVPDAGAAWSGWTDVHGAHLSYFTGPALDRLCLRAGFRIAGTAAPFAGTLWRDLACGERSMPLPAPAEEIGALDRHLDASLPHGWARPKSWVKRRVKRGLVMALGPEWVGARQRRHFQRRMTMLLGPNAGTRRRILGLPIDALTMAAAVARAEAAMAGGGALRHGDINVAKLVAMQRDERFRLDIEDCGMICADGMGIVWAARLLGAPLPERVTGIDLMEKLLARAALLGYRPFILGARRAILDAAIANLRRRHPALVFAGWRDGYFSPAEEADIVAGIAASGADCLFVALPSPAKEAFLARHRDALKVPFVMGVGGAVDVIAGLRWRAPIWVQRAGLEWLARLVQEPLRLGPRYIITNSRFAWLVFRAWLAR